MTKIHIVDYGFNNLNSLFNTFNKISNLTSISSNIEDLDKADYIILPGVGSFKSGITNIKKMRLDSYLSKNFEKKKFLAICLSMQLVFNKSEESPNFKGLEFLTGSIVNVQKIESKRIINIGWERLDFTDSNNSFKNINQFNKYFFYFAHKYCLDPSTCQKNKILSNMNNTKIPAIIKHENFIGLQFHPEKSGEAGVELVRYLIDNMNDI